LKNKFDGKQARSLVDNLGLKQMSLRQISRPLQL